MPEVSFEPDWGQTAAQPMQFANLFAVQVGGDAGALGIPDGIYVAVGSAAPPIILGTAEEVLRQVEATHGKIPVIPVARFAMSRERAQELADLLLAQIAQFDASVRERQGVSR